jgi:hypothetical protein
MSKELDREAFSNFVRALAFASHKHSQQRRKDADASPYINHPIALVSILAVEAGINDCDTLCAALLHDTSVRSRPLPVPSCRRLLPPLWRYPDIAEETVQATGALNP